MWAVDHWDVKPDILISAKGIASGMTLGAMIARADLMEHWGPGAHGSTYGGNPVACAAALATLDLLEDGLVENAARPRRAGAAPAPPAARAAPRARARCPRQGPDARRRVRYGRRRRGRPVGGVPAWAARTRMRQVGDPDEPATDGDVGGARHRRRPLPRRHPRRRRTSRGSRPRGGRSRCADGCRSRG